jgi:hypothetical protein
MKVEMGVALDDGTWNTVIITIPNEIPDELVEVAAKDVLDEMGIADAVGYWLLYNSKGTNANFLVACLNSFGESTLVPVRVQFYGDDTDNLYDAALKWADKNGYDRPMTFFDESDDLPASVWECFDWDNAPITTKE